MTTFDRREEAFESMFAHDEEMQFKAVARRARMLGLWAAGLQNKSGVEAEAYAADMVTFSIEHGHEQDLFDRVRADLTGLVDDVELRERMAALMSEAQHHVRTA